MEINEKEHIIGQEHLFGSTGPIKRMLDNDSFTSFILYGPSGIGKTTIANFIANKVDRDVFNLNATKTSKAEFEKILKDYQNIDILIIIDEVHRLDKQKQNMFLPYLEKDNLIIIGTTTENPIYNLHNAFLSRVLLFETKSIKNEALFNFIKRLNETKYKQNILTNNTLNKIVTCSGNDIRKAKQYFEFIVTNYKDEELTEEIYKTIFKPNIKYEADGDRHYDLISAFQKSIRASDVNAALFYLAALLSSGDYDAILRRLSVIAYEDIGLANFNITNKVYNAIEVFKSLGMPEGRIILANIVIELALSPKSTTAYNSLDKAILDINENPNFSVPPNIRQNRDENNRYIKEECFYTSNLPDKYKYKEYLEFKGNSKYEETLKERYAQLKEQKNEPRNIRK